MKRHIQFEKGDRLTMRLPPEGDAAPDETTIEFIVLRETKGGFQLQNASDGNPRCFREPELAQLILEGRVTKVATDGSQIPVAIHVPPPDAWHLRSPEQRACALRRKHACDEFRKEFPNSDSHRGSLKAFVARHAADRAFPGMMSWHSLRNWLKIYWPNHPPIMLCDELHQGGRRFEDTVAKVVDTMIDKGIMSSIPATRKVIHDRIVKKIMKLNGARLQRDPTAKLLVVPSYQTICRVIGDLDAYEVARYQHCLAVAENKFNIRGQVDWVPSAGKLVSIDATEIDLWLVDGNGNLLGRLWWTVVQCVVTGMIMGWYFSLKRPNAAIIVAALRHAIRRKPSIAKLFGGFVMNEFEPYGLFEMVLLDNALEHLGHEVKRCLEAIGIINVEFARTYDPTKRGQSERCFLTANHAVFHHLPAAVRHGPSEKPRIDPKSLACVMFPDVDRLVHKLAVDIHPYAYVKRLKGQRIKRWRSDHATMPPNPPSDASLQGMTGGSFEHTLTHQGIPFMGAWYGTNKELGRLRIADKARNSKFQCRWDPDDMGMILVDNGDGNFQKATVQDKSRIGATLLDVEIELFQQTMERDMAARQQKPHQLELDEEMRQISKPKRRIPADRSAADEGMTQDGPPPAATIGEGGEPGRLPARSHKHSNGLPPQATGADDAPDLAAIAALKSKLLTGVLNP